MSAGPPEGPASEPSGDSAAIELGRILDELGHARRQMLRRSERLLRATDPSVAWSASSTTEQPAVTREDPLQPLPVAPPVPAPLAQPVAQDATGRVVAAALQRSRSLARPVATVVTTVTVVLLAWLLVLEPLLGSRPVLVRDDGMSPSLRTGDVAFAEDPAGELTPGTIVAVRVDGRVRVSRLIDRELPPDAPAGEVRTAIRLVLRDDAQGLEDRTVVDADALVGVVGAAVPRVGLPAVWLRAPTSAPLGAALTLALLAVTALGLRDARQERRAMAGRTRPPSPSTR
jgi:hypothetical protein